MTTTDGDNTLDAGERPETEAHRKLRRKVFTRFSRLGFYIIAFAFESIVVGIGNIALGRRYPWAVGFNLIAAILAVFTCIYPFLRMRASKTPPARSYKMDCLKVLGLMHLPVCVLTLLALMAFSVLTVMHGTGACNVRDEYDPDLTTNNCFPDVAVLFKLSILDVVLFAIKFILLAFMTSLSWKNRSMLKIYSQPT